MAEYLKGFKTTDDVAQFTTAVTGLAQLLGSVRGSIEDPFDVRILETVRTFVSSFDQHHQRKVVVQLFSDFMRAADREQLADELQRANHPDELPPATDGRPASIPLTTRASGTSSTLIRWLLSPRTSWHAQRLVRTSAGQLDFDTAWRSVRVQLHPDEYEFRAHGHQPPVSLNDPAQQQPTLPEIPGGS